MHTGHGTALRASALAALGLAFAPLAAHAQTVAPPAFLPVDGTSVTTFPVVITCPTAGAVIRYTVSGAEPTIYDPTVTSGGTVQVPRTMTLKAKAWSNGTPTAITSTTTSVPFDVTGDIASGSQFTLALVSNGQVQGWGNQDFGRLANNSTATTNVSAPTAARYSSTSTIANALRLSSGSKHSVMLDNAGNIWAWGNNLSGEAGRATPTELLYANRVLKSATTTDFLTNCNRVAAGLDFSAAVENGGFVQLWGNQVSGRLANGSTAAGTRKFAGRAKLNATTDLTGILDLALGKDFALAREAHALETPGTLGRLYVWGANTNAQLALGNTTTQAFATRAKLNATTDLADVWDLDAGDTHAAVVRWKTGDPALQGTV